MSKEHGGPAFPSKKRIFRAGYPTEEFAEIEGMTLRDYFAAKAMLIQPWHDENDNYQNHADRCYSMADAMLRARK